MFNKKRLYPIASVVVTLVLITVLVSHNWSPTKTSSEATPNKHVDNEEIPNVEHFSKKYDSNGEYTRVEYTNSNPSDKDTVLFASSVDGSESYGLGRDFQAFYKTLESLFNDKYSISLGFLVNSDDEYDKVVDFFESKALKSAKVSRIVIVQAPFLDNTYQVDAASRHDNQLQRQRRSKIAKIRNFLLFNALSMETYTLFIDSDVRRLKNPNLVLDTFIDSKLDIVVPRVLKGRDGDYDMNSWRGERKKPSPEVMAKLDANLETNFVPEDVPNKMYHFANYLADEKGEYQRNKDNLKYVVPLDSVGGAVLFAKSIIYKQGILFPTTYVVGTTWERNEGYDGIETEGLCYLAKPAGYKCWGMPNQLAYHADR